MPPMPLSSDRSVTVVELALQSLQDQRTSCVARLQAVLEAPGRDTEVEGYLKLIDNINAALIRLASAHIVH
jgi:hypothetical protein